MKRPGVARTQRATAYLLRDVEQGGEMMSRIDGYVVVLDSSDRPRAIWSSSANSAQLPTADGVVLLHTPRAAR